MKVSLAIAALLGYTSAIQLEGNNLSQVHQEVKSLIEKQMSEEIKAAATPEDATKKDADLKKLGESLGKKVVDELTTYGVPYGYPLYPYVPYTSPYYSDIAGIVSSANAYYDYVRRYEAANAAAKYYNSPAYDDVVKALRAAYSPAAPSAAQTPAKQSLIQTEGIPVYVNPVLRKNEAGDEDLQQRDIVIDGVNGFDYVQTQGVPVLVHPESMILQNSEAATNLGFVDMECGPDELSFLMQQHHDFLNSQRPEDDTILQVNGVPVIVHPESMLLSNTQASTNLGLVDMEIGADEVSAVQLAKDLKNIDDGDMAGAIEGFNQLMVKINNKYTKK